MSSANNIVFDLARKLGKSLAYKKNNIGPRVVPCGTPQVRERGSEARLFTIVD